MIEKLLNLANWQKYLAFIVMLSGLIFSCITWYQGEIDRAYKDGYDAAIVKIQKDYNNAIADQTKQHQDKVAGLIKDHSEKVEKAIAEVDAYWQDYYSKKEQTLNDAHAQELNALRIKNEADTITDTLHPDTVRLLKQAYGSIDPPNYFRRARTTGNTEASSDN